jgi:glucose/arabinose dehydrogenase
MFVTDIGQGTVEELNVVTEGDNLGWNVWEGSFRYAGRSGVSTEGTRADRRVVYPIAEYDHTDPLIGARSAVTGLAVYRGNEIPDLTGHVLWGDLPSGEMFAVPADHLPMGGQSAIRRVLFASGGEARPLLSLIQEKNRAQGRDPAGRADLRFHPGNEGRIYLLNKADGVVRVLIP